MLTRLAVPRFLAAAALVVLFGAACGDDSDDDPMNPIDPCSAVALPVGGANANAPTVTDVALEVQGDYIVLHATVTDPQGDANLQNIDQTIGVFQDDACGSTTVNLVDDIANSGQEETFGTVTDVMTNAALHAAIAASVNWPVELHIRDADNNITHARVRARVFN